MHTSSIPRWPTVPTAGARVALVCASGPVRGEGDVVRAESHCVALGFEPVRGAHVLAHHGYLAGDDAQRRADLQWALDDETIDVVWCLRGGYGMTRLLPALSFEAFRARPKPVIGFSDVTALHCAIAARVGTVTFHTHNARAAMPPMSLASLRAALMGGEPCGHWPEAVIVRAGHATGRLAGGNLALLAALCGTRDALRADGAILVLEDIKEPAYRVDRMLRQLEQAGALAGIMGLAVGQFTDVPDDAHPDAPEILAIIRELADRLQVPCLANLPIGHIPDQWTLPLGATASLDPAGRTLSIHRDSAVPSC